MIFKPRAERKQRTFRHNDRVFYRVRTFVPLFRLYTLTDGRRVWGERVRVVERLFPNAHYWEMAEAVLDKEPVTCNCGSARHKPRTNGPTPCL